MKIQFLACLEHPANIAATARSRKMKNRSRLLSLNELAYCIRVSQIALHPAHAFAEFGKRFFALRTSQQHGLAARANQRANQICCDEPRRSGYQSLVESIWYVE